jgi:uncharacterized membrane protein YphA (DoxX/SURF4 family)
VAIALWIVQILLGLIFAITGSFKFFQSREKVIASGGAWAEDFAPAAIKIISGTELISGLSLIIGKVLKDGRYLSFMGAAVIAVIMTGSIFVHIRRREYQHAMINTVFWLMALFVAYACRAFLF